jgi:hypothetical protein
MGTSAEMRIRKCAHVQVYEYADVQTCRSANMHMCRHADLRACRCVHVKQKCENMMRVHEKRSECPYSIDRLAAPQGDRVVIGILVAWIVNYNRDIPGKAAVGYAPGDDARDEGNRTKLLDETESNEDAFEDVDDHGRSGAAAKAMDT